MQTNLKGFVSTVFWSQESREIRNVQAQGDPIHPNIRSRCWYVWPGGSAMGTMPALRRSTGLSHVTPEIHNLPLPSHTPTPPHTTSTFWLNSLTPKNRLNKSCSFSKEPWTRGATAKVVYHRKSHSSHYSWAVAQIPIKNLHFPKNSEQLSPKMSRCWALLSEKARAFSKWNRLFGIKNSK